MADLDQPDKADIPVAAPEPDEATELLRELTPKLDPDHERELAERIHGDYHAGLQDRGEWETRLAEWEDAYYNRVPDKDFPWPGASNFHVPITMMGIETFKPRLVEGVLGQIPPIVLIPTTGGSEDKKDKVEAFLNWQVQTKLKLGPLVMQSSHLFLQPGIAIAKTYWKVDRVRRRMVREFPLDTPMRAILEAIFGTDQMPELEVEDEMEWTGSIPTSPQGGPPLDVRLKFKALEDTWQVLVEREEVTERPAVDLIEPIDLIGPAKGGQDVADLPWLIHRLWWYEDDLRAKVILGRLDKDAVQALLDQRKGQPSGDQPQTDSGAYRRGQAQTEGIEDQGPSNARRNQYEILETYRRWDIDGDGIDEEIIVWTSVDLLDQILGWDYLDNVYAHGRRPIRIGKYFPIPFRFYGLSFPEVVKGIQDEINAIHNQKVDYATIQNMPFFFYRASASMPAISMQLKPGQGVPIDNPQQDVQFPKWQGSAAWGAQEEATLLQYNERLTGLTDLSIGRQPNRVGATRTAKGTQTLLSEAGLRFKMALQAFQEFWGGIFSDILALNQEYLPPDQEFRVTGKRPTVMRIKDRTELRGQYDLRIASSAETLNRQQLREDATVLMQATLNPAIIQVGLMGLKGIRRAYTKLYRAYGEDPDLWLEPKAPIRGPEEELMYFAAGNYIPPTPGEDVALHLATHQQQKADPSIAHLMTPEARQMLERHLQETLVLKQTQEMVATMQQGGGKPPVGPQAVNAEQGKQPMAAPASSPNGVGMAGTDG